MTAPHSLPPDAPLLSVWSAPPTLDEEALAECRAILARLRPIVHDRRANSATLAELAVVMAYLPRLCAYLEHVTGDGE